MKGEPKLVGTGLYRQVFRVENTVLKIWKGEKNLKDLQKRAVDVDSHQREIRKKVDFLPAYYGTVLAEVERDGAVHPAVVTFHEYVDPLPMYSIGALKAVFDLIGRASGQGYVLDIKLSNFGMKNGHVSYLDEYGVGKGPLPPDVLEDLNKLVQLALSKIKRVPP